MLCNDVFISVTFNNLKILFYFEKKYIFKTARAIGIIKFGLHIQTPHVYLMITPQHPDNVSNINKQASVQ